MKYRNWDIYGYDLSALKEFRITTGESGRAHPAIYGNIVVWEDKRKGNWDIYGYDLSTQKEFQITTNESDQEFPAIYGSMVVWEDTRNENSDIYGVRLDVNSSPFISEEAHFFFEKGEKEFEEKNYESALYFFQLAKETYTRGGDEEKIRECDEWIQKCQTELEGVCTGTYLILIFVFLGVLISIERWLNLYIEIGE